MIKWSFSSRGMEWWSVFLLVSVPLCLSQSEIERSLSIREDAGLGSSVGFVTDTPDLAARAPMFVFAHTPESGVAEKFVLDERSGEIRTKAPLDYEYQSSYVLLAIPKTGGRGIRVVIQVQDINDNSPVFAQREVSIELSELSKIGTETALPIAIDRDSPKFGVKRYEIVSGNDAGSFRLATKPFNDNLFVDLVLTRRLDFERQQAYRLAVVAYDGGSPPRQATLVVTVRVLNANDHAPLFDLDHYGADIDSTYPVGVEIMRVQASDPDGHKDSLSYVLLPSPKDAHRHFAINPRSGAISLRARLPPMGTAYELYISAKDSGSTGSLETTTTVQINVRSPSNTLMEFDITYLTDNGRPSVSEDVRVDALIAKITVENRNSKTTYTDVSISLHQSTPEFSLNSTDKAGVFTLHVAKKLDREIRDRYRLQLFATRLQDPEDVLRHDISLNVRDINDNAPAFDKDQYSASVSERAMIGAPVLRVSATDNDSGPNARLTYELQESSSDAFRGWFAIEPSTGLITTAASVNCAVVPRAELTVLVRDGGVPPLSNKTKININIVDVNDNSPTFEHAIYNLSISEDTLVGDCFWRAIATDADCGLNAQVTYKLSKPSTVFDLDPASGRLCTKAALDYETEKSYQFTVQAYDGGGLHGTTLLQVYIEDVNDNKPVFYPVQYNTSLREDTPAGQAILMVFAKDADGNAYGRVTYKLIGGDGAGMFRLDEETGEIYLERALRQSPSASYTLNIDAQDGEGLRAETWAVVSISVVGSQFPSPVFESTRYRFTVREDTLPGISIGSVRATGPSRITYSIYSGDPQGNFRMDGSEGQLELTQYVDHDMQGAVLLNVQAAMGSPPVYSHAQVFVQIEDVNDNSPTFATSATEVAIYENWPSKTAIFVVQASDKDSGRNGEINYAILSGNDHGMFLLNPASGVLTLMDELDYESRREYVLVVQASDGGIPPRRSNVTLTIAVLDFNDNAPAFAKKEYRISVPENSQPLMEVLHLSARDLDTGANAQLNYLILSQHPAEDFAVYGDSGRMYVLGQLDRERIDSYSIVVSVSDGGHMAEKSANTTVIVTVADINDNRPLCPQPPPTLSVHENKPSNTLVGTFEAFDPDYGRNGSVTYELLDASDNFFIEGATGSIFAARSLDHEQSRSHHLRIRATDGGGLTSECFATVAVEDENDNAPYFLLPHQTRLFLVEERPAGVEVVQVRAADRDEAVNDSIAYSLQQKDAPFAIDMHTGVITSKRTFDYETDIRSHKLTVIATDAGRPPLSARLELLIEITDMADGGSLMARNDSVLHFEVSENSKIGSKIGHITLPASASLSTANAEQISYQISAGNSLGIFEVDQSSGELYLVDDMDYEMAAMHFLTVEVTHMPSSTRGSTYSVVAKIFVQDENDNAPVFTEDPVMIPIQEDADVGALIWQFNATDADTGPNGRLHYALVNQSPESVFAVDTMTGSLWLERALDYERFNHYVVILEATDQAEDVQLRRSSRVTAQIYVTDINDNSPIFSSRTQISILEDEPAGFPLVHVVAEDADWADNGRVDYELTRGNEAKIFNINVTSGALTLARRLDRNDHRRYQLEVTARDNGRPRRYATQTLDVKVESVFDDAPRFTQSIYYANVTENGAAGQFVAHVKAQKFADDESPEDLLYVLPRGGSGGAFVIDERTGVVKTARSLDRENKAQYILSAYVRDQSYPARYDAATLIVHILDQNDNPPRITPSSCTPIEVPENQVLLDFHRILAIDKDETNGLEYRITAGNTDSKFYLNPSSGQLSCDPLDHEKTALYNLTVTVFDGSGLEHSCAVVVRVADANDNQPRFPQDSYVLEVPEDSPINGHLLSLRATDADDDMNAELSYLLEGGEDATFFDIGADDGVLTLKKRLDYEAMRTLRISVVAKDKGATISLSASTEVTIHILDVNDNAPEFSHWTYSVNVSNELDQGQELLKVQATDRDGEGPNSEVMYSFVPPPPSGLKIDSKTGSIKSSISNFLLTHSLHSPHSREPIAFRVRATDLGSPRSMSSTSLVQLWPGSASTPSTGHLQFTNRTYRASVIENAPTAMHIVSVRATRLGLSEGIEYEILAGNDDFAFRVEPLTGELRVANSTLLDFETRETYYLVVQAHSLVGGKGQTQAFATVIVQLRDVNDNPPRFQQQVYTAAVYESRPRRTPVIKLTATDADEAGKAPVSYSIVGGNTDNAFAIEHDGGLTTNLELDRETTASYALTVMAEDNGSPDRLSSTATVNVLVLDSNDNAPVFTDDGRTIVVSEVADTEIGTVIATMTAVDRDSGPALSYDFVDGGNPDGLFALDRFSGRLSVARTLDYERRRVYDVDVQVSDDIHTVVTRRRVELTDVNDNAPVFLQSFYQISLPEDTPAGTTVVSIVATDADSGDNARLEYAIADIRPAVPGLWIDQHTGEISLNRSAGEFPLTARLIELTIIATDHGIPGLSALCTAQIQIVQPSARSQPRFAQNYYRFSLSENASLHTTVGSVPATSDTPSGEQVLYSVLSGDPGRHFRIDHEGRLILQRQVDREATPEFNLQVAVHTQTNSVSNSTAQVFVQIEDINDNAPLFEQVQREVEVVEDLALNDLIATVAASDADAGENGEVTYSISSGNDDSVFAIDAHSGVVTLAGRLDYEKKTTHKLVIRAQDSGIIPQSSLSTIVVRVVDQNDNSPFFPVQNYLARIPEDAPIGTGVFTARARDLDSGKYGRLTYRLLSGDTEVLTRLTIDRFTGEVKSTGLFDYESQSAYKFTVAAFDSDNRTATVVAQLVITGVDEFTPVFLDDSYVFRVSYSSMPGDVLGSVFASDHDAGFDGLVRYRLEERSEFFEIHESTGVLSVKSELDVLDNQSRRSRNSEKDARIRRSIIETYDDEVDQVMELKVSASSGPWSAPRSNSTTVRIELGHFVRNPAAFTSTFSPIIISAVCAALVLLILGILCCIVAQLRRSQNNRKKAPLQPSTPAVSIPRSAPPAPIQPPETYGRKSIPKPKPPARQTSTVVTTSASVIQTIYGANRSDLDPRLQLPSQTSARSHDSARDSVLEDDVWQQQPSRAASRVARSAARDSGHVSQEDSQSNGSGGCLTAQEYLSSLGIATEDPQQPFAKPAPSKGALDMSVEDDPDLRSLLYSHLPDAIHSQEASRVAPRPKSVHAPRHPPNGAFPSSTSTSSFHPNANWGPSYQPLTQVFNEIARYKSQDSLRRPQPPAAARSTDSVERQRAKAAFRNTGNSSIQSPANMLPQFVATPSSEAGSNIQRQSQCSDVEIKI